MNLECTCLDIDIGRWEQLLNDSQPINYDWLVMKIKKQMPDLYERLALQFYNPYCENAKVTKTHYVLVHSAIEYFIKK